MVVNCHDVTFHSIFSIGSIVLKVEKAVLSLSRNADVVFKINSFSLANIATKLQTSSLLIANWMRIGIMFPVMNPILTSI